MELSLTLSLSYSSTSSNAKSESFPKNKKVIGFFFLCVAPIRLYKEGSGNMNGKFKSPEKKVKKKPSSTSKAKRRVSI
jgi:hypothetical protein